MPLAELVINNHNTTSTSVSPFFLTHSYHIYPVELDNIEVPIRERISLIQRGEAIIQKLRDAYEWAQASIAVI
jgi:hypothetical protein